MAFDSKGLDDYIDVAQRIAEFRVKHPEGSLQPLNPEQPFEIRELAGTGKDGKEVRGTFIIYTAAAYRSPDDRRPGVGCAYEVFPGRTPYTAGSELQNAETAAWGRAIVAVLAADTRPGIASQQEVRNRQAESGQSAGDVFENATPAAGRQVPRAEPAHKPAAAAQRPHLAPAQDGAQPGTWYDDAIAKAAGFETEPAGQKLWREAAAAGRDGLATRGQVTHVQNLITARIDDRHKEAAKGILQPLAEGDPWRDKILDGLAGDEEARAALAEVRDLHGSGQMDDERAALFGRAIIARWPKAAVKEMKAAARKPEAA